jgi:hypothetical protein
MIKRVLAVLVFVLGAPDQLGDVEAHLKYKKYDAGEGLWMNIQ